MVSEGERRRRYTRLREEMEKAGYEIVLVAGREGAVGRGAVRYLSDWHIWGGTGYIVVPLRGEPSLILGSNSQAMWAKRIGWIEDVRVGMHGPVPETLGVLRRHRVAGTLGVVGMGRFMAHDDVRAFRDGLPGVELANADPTFEAVRRIKSDEEIRMITETSEIVADAMRAFERALAPGKTERQCVAEAWRVAREGGVIDGIAHITHEEPAFIRPPTDRKIERGDVVKFSMELAGANGYQIELAAVFSFTEPGEEYRRMFATVMRAKHKIRSLLRPGVRHTEIAEAVEAIWAEDGWTPNTRVIWDGHGIGLDVIEPPLLLRGSQETLEANMVMNIHPGLAYGDRMLGMYIQDNYVVREGGAEPLSGWEHRWHVVG
jgi:Xaa-Pro aminopeptidase